MTQIVCLALRPAPLERTTAAKRPSGERIVRLALGAVALPAARLLQSESDSVWRTPARA